MGKAKRSAKASRSSSNADASDAATSVDDTPIENETPARDDNAPQGLVVVAVGSSAGGLEALQALVSNLPTDVGMAFIVAQHLSASYKSMMTELLGRQSTLPVVTAEDGLLMQPNSIYVCPPAANVTVAEGDRLILTPVAEGGPVPKPSIDLLFRSLANVKKERAIGVVLSGTGTDGTAGVRAIKEADGFSIAQDPESAKYDGMPNSAINTGKVDLIMDPEDIGVELNGIALLPDRPVHEFEESPSREVYHRILRILRRVHGVDFTSYKDNTLSRRIMRRMIARQCNTIEAYELRLREDEEELLELFNDLLIGVTSFFRDPDAWNSLESRLRTYLETKEGNTIRCWVAGCSTGEEAYTLAILLSEILGDALDEYRVQIFATDISSRSIAIGRRGFYAAPLLDDLPEELVARYFTLHQSGEYEVQKALKQMVVFSEHDMTKDPPFLRQDLICCRNVLIYFKPELQEAVLPVFTYSLLPGSVLFLGQAESLGQLHSSYDVVSAKSKIYRPRFTTGRPAPPPSASREMSTRERRSATTVEAAPSKRRRLAENLDALVTIELERLLTPSAVLINSADDIVFSHGEGNPLLIRKQGLPSDNIYDNLIPELCVDLRTAIHMVGDGTQVAITNFRNVQIGTDAYWCRLMVAAVEHPEFADLRLVYCQAEDTLEIPLGVLTGEGTPTDIVVRDQEKLIAKLREQLSIVVEQLEGSNAEMQALNEELQSANEELQSSNEELETTNEELQSTNEELQTAYAELSVSFDEKQIEEDKNRELTRALQDANALLEQAEIVGMSGSWRWQPATNQIVFSKGTYRLLGLEEGVTPSFEQFLSFACPEDRDKLDRYVQDIMTEGKREPIEFRVVKLNGDELWVSLRTAVTFSSYQQVETVLGILHDIDRKKSVERELVRAANRVAEKELQIQSRDKALEASEESVLAVQKQLDSAEDELEKSKERIKFVLASSANGVYLYDFEKGSNSFINESYKRILGYEGEELGALSQDEFGELFHPDDLSRIRTHMARMQGLGEGETREIRYRFKHRAGHWLDLYSLDTVFDTDEDGQAKTMLGTFFEVQPS